MQESKCIVSSAPSGHKPDTAGQAATSHSADGTHRTLPFASGTPVAAPRTLVTSAGIPSVSARTLLAKHTDTQLLVPPL